MCTFLRAKDWTMLLSQSMASQVKWILWQDLRLGKIIMVELYKCPLKSKEQELMVMVRYQLVGRVQLSRMFAY